MPNIRFPKLKLDFLKKLLPKKPEGNVAPEPAAHLSSGKQEVEKAKDKEKEAAARHENSLEECPICHDPVGMKNPEGILESWVHLHCNHKFGTQCIQTWLQESAEREPHAVPSCPICRAPAKHPCGHPVIIPAQRLHHFATLAALPLSPPTLYPSPVRLRNRPRRRLARRFGHPRRPPPPEPPRVRVQTVGECSTCAAAAAAKERMREMTMTSAEVGGPPYGGRRRDGIKSMLLQTGLRRLSWSTLEPTRNDNDTTYMDVPGDRPVLPTLPRGAHLEYINLCRTEVTVARSPTPGPSTRVLMSY